MLTSLTWAMTEIEAGMTMASETVRCCKGSVLGDGTVCVKGGRSVGSGDRPKGRTGDRPMD